MSDPILKTPDILTDIAKWLPTIQDHFQSSTTEFVRNVSVFPCILQLNDSMENMIHERQEEKKAMDESIQKLQAEKKTQGQKIVDLVQKVNIVGKR